MELGQGPLTPQAHSRLVLRSRLGALTLVLLCAVQFLDIVDFRDRQRRPAVHPACPELFPAEPAVGGERLHPHLRRVPSSWGPLGRPTWAASHAADRSGHLRSVLLDCRLGAGFGAPRRHAAGSGNRCSIDGSRRAVGAHDQLSRRKDRNTALGVWGAISGMAAAAGVFLGGVLSAGPGWRWVFFVNPPICVLVAVGAFVLLTSDPGLRGGETSFDPQGAVLVTGGMLVLVYSLIRAPIVGWGSIQTIATLSLSAFLLVAFAINELRSRNPLLPIAILRVKGLLVAPVIN